MSKHWQTPQKPYHFLSMRFKLATKTAQNKWKDYAHISHRLGSSITCFYQLKVLIFDTNMPFSRMSIVLATILTQISIISH